MQFHFFIFDRKIQVLAIKTTNNIQLQTMKMQHKRELILDCLSCWNRVTRSHNFKILKTGFDINVFLRTHVGGSRKITNFQSKFELSIISN